MRAALYLRVSTTDRQTTENQRMVLAKVAEHRGWEIVQVLHVTNAFAELDAARVALYSDQQAIDSTTPMGRAMSPNDWQQSRECDPGAA